MIQPSGSPQGAAGAPRRVLVTGVTGFIGRHLLATLVARGDDVIGLTRRPDAAVDLGRDRLVVGELDDPAVLDRAMAGAHAVVHLAAATRTSDPVEARRVNVAGTRALVQSARAAGVCRMVVLSTVTVHRDLVGAYGATKREMEAVIDAAGVDAVILRPSLVYGPGAFGLFHRMTELVRALPVVPIIGPGDDRLRPVHVDDVVAAIVTSLDPSRAAGPSYDLVGPDEVTMEEFLGRIEAVYGLRRRHLHVPVPLARAGARGLAKVMREPPVSMDNIVGTGQPTPHDPEPARRDLGLPSIGLRRGLPTVTDPPPWVARHGRPVRVVVVGLGKMGVAHTALLSMVPGARVAAVVDPDAGLGKVVRGIGFGAPWFASLEAAVDATAPDAVVIATPTHTHPDLVVTAARHGAAVLVEKPLAHTLGAALIMADAVNIAGVTASCGYTLGYLPSFERAHDLLAGGVVGEIRRFRGGGGISQVFGPKQGWMYDPARSGGGVAANVGSHLLFLLHWYFGAASEVSATTSGRHTMAEDQANIALRFAGGVEGDVEMSWSMPGYPLSATAIDVIGDNGELHVDNQRLTVDLRHPAGALPAGRTVIDAARLRHPALFDLGGEGYYREDEDFVRALGNGDPVRTSLARAVEVQRMLDAIYRSAAGGGAPVLLHGHVVAAEAKS